MSPSTPASALAIAGSDSSGAAGIQADLKTFAAHRVHGLSVVTALGAQHTRGVIALHVPPVAILQAQIEACFDDAPIHAVKIGLLPDAEAIHAVADALQRHRPPQVVLDPVMACGENASQQQEDAVQALRERLLPMATLLTASTTTAALLVGQSISDGPGAERAAGTLDLGAGAVLLRGGHLREGSRVVDRFFDGVSSEEFIHARLPLQARGCGSTLSAAIAAQLCNGLSLANACEAAIDYVARALQHGHVPGQGETVVLDHVGAAPHA